MQLNSDKAVAVCVQYFLRTLMRLERERYGWSKREAALKAKWDTELWRSLENYEIPIEPHHWINISVMLELHEERLVRRMNAFIKKNPVLLIGEDEDQRLNVFEKRLTSPRALQSKKVFTLSLSPVRELLFDILSLYVAEGEALIETAKAKGYYQNRPEPPLKPSFRLKNTEEKREHQRNRLARFMQEKIPDDKLDALEDALELLVANKKEDVERAIQVLSLILKTT